MDLDAPPPPQSARPLSTLFQENDVQLKFRRGDVDVSLCNQGTASLEYELKVKLLVTPAPPELSKRAG